MKTITYFSRDKRGCPSDVVDMTLVSYALFFLFLGAVALLYGNLVWTDHARVKREEEERLHEAVERSNEETYGSGLSETQAK